MRSVSKRPGAMQLTVMPFGPSSRASVFDQPTTPGRTAFDSARLSTGSFTVLEVTVTIRPWPDRSRWGRQSAVSRTAETSSSCTVASMFSSFISSADVRGGPPELCDDDVDAAEGFDRPLDEPLEVSGYGDVAADGECSQPVCFALEHIAPAREHRDVRAFLGQRFRDAEPDAGGRAADDRRPSLSPRSTAPEGSWRALRRRYLCVRTETTSRTAAADALTAFFSSAERRSFTISSIPAAPSFTGTPM